VPCSATGTQSIPAYVDKVHGSPRESCNLRLRYVAIRLLLGDGMGTGWRHLALAGGLRLAVLGLIGAVGAVAVGGGAATLTAVRAKEDGKPGAGQLTPAQGLVASRAAALARAGARASTLSAALSGLRTQAEALAERYDREVSLEQQAGAAYQAAEVRLAAARTSEQRAAAQLARLAAAEYESDGGPDMAAAVFEGITDPRGYLGAIGLQQAMDNQRADLLAATQADEIVTRLFGQQAAGLLAQRRAAAQAAGFLKAAVIAAVGRQAATVRVADASRSRLAAETAGARGREAAIAAADGAGRPAVPPVVSRPAAVAASVLAGGPSGAAPGVFAPDWASDAGASAAQGDVAADWALTQLGKPYRWGAAGPGSYDCSGLALQAWARAGIRLLHWTGFQWVSGPHVPLASLRRGDLVFYAFNVADPATIHHVGIYLGHGLMVDAPYTGSFVRIDSIYAFPGLIGASRPAA
jgi:cell wall-associated NlpC family hydrolase